MHSSTRWSARALTRLVSLLGDGLTPVGIVLGLAAVAICVRGGEACWMVARLTRGFRDLYTVSVSGWLSSLLEPVMENEMGTSLLV